MTRAALRILNRARADAWRRVGIPLTWTEPAAPAPDPAGGQNVAGEDGEHAGNGRPAIETPDVTTDKPKP
jgi:hypothetical protein